MRLRDDADRLAYDKNYDEWFARRSPYHARSELPAPASKRSCSDGSGLAGAFLSTSAAAASTAGEAGEAGAAYELVAAAAGIPSPVAASAAAGVSAASDIVEELAARRRESARNLVEATAELATAAANEDAASSARDAARIAREAAKDMRDAARDAHRQVCQQYDAAAVAAAGAAAVRHKVL